MLKGNHGYGEGGAIKFVLVLLAAGLPFFKELDGSPEYEAIQASMAEHLNANGKNWDWSPLPHGY